MHQGSLDSLSLTTKQAQQIAYLMGRRGAVQVTEITWQEILARLLAAEKWETLLMT